MKKNVFTCPAAPGSRRESARIYTHAIVAEFDRAAFIADLPKQLAKAGLYRDDFEFYQYCAGADVGDPWPGKNPHNFRIRHEHITDGERKMDACGGTYEGWLEIKRALILDEHNKRLAADTGKTFVHQWCMSETNARRALSKYAHPLLFNADLRVEPVIQIK